jgi:hypothetical protein
MPPDPPALRRGRRLVERLIAGMSAVQLGCLTRDLEKLDQAEPITAGEIALGRAIDVRLTARLLRERGFSRTGWNGGSGLHREPIYKRPN